MGGFGAPDRGGSRESKKASLRANKQNLAKAAKLAEKPKGPRPTFTEPAPPALPPTPGCAALVDAAAQLASRQFDRDQFKVLQRAASSGVGPIIAYTTDDGKLDALARTAKENAGQVYCMLGVHSDNIKRANDRLAPARMEQLRDLALEPGCVALLTGLAFRDVGIRYAQERALTEQMELAASVGLPVVLYEVRAAEALCERILEFRASGAGEGRAASTRLAVFNFGGSPEELRAYLDLGCYIMLTGRVCDQTEKGEALRALAASVPLDRLMLASDAPLATPQNINDAFVREGRNEPSNLPYVLEALAPAFGIPAAELAAATRCTTLEFFGIREAADAAAEAAAAAAVGTSEAAAGGGAGQEGLEPEATAGERGTAAAPKGAESGDEEEGGEDDEQNEEEEEEEEEEEPAAAASGKQKQQQKKKGGGGGGAGKAANLFAQLQLQEEGEGDGSEEGEEADGAEGAGRAAASAGAGPSGSSSAAAGGGAAGRRGAGAGRPAPRNFVAEYAAAAAAKGPVAGPRVSYACRGCRSVLFSEADTEPHADEERALFASTKPRRKGRGKRGDDSEAALCSYHFLGKPLAWMETCMQAEDGAALGEGRLVCPTCSSKLGKWALAGADEEQHLGAAGGGGGGRGAGRGGRGGAGEGGGIQCACGVVVPAPAYGLLRARLDILDAQLDIASAVQASLDAYEQGGQEEPSSSSGEDGGGKKKRGKQKRNKTANFSSFRNKNFGFRVKDQKALQESVVATVGADKEDKAGAGAGGGRRGGKEALGAVREDGDDGSD
ncbi:hypothetical protein HYH03_004265 [Edaphochlamys debaryana]|uniref:TatD related DNase n=1 Tax=Edaphochlamys debaryana TaxID=47281 RepID=A0A835YAN9_9CHLO|nr:hypothetical protein HYH03_004265 [Edaphochlamys debaryana]|eukprot:KAG2498007.1 hypothetical protein HYH03_004265 [Edaphochlamys debaryana]